MNHLFSDIAVMTKRNLTHVRRLPQLIVFSTIQPVMFMLLFAYVFGGAIKTGAANYIQYLLPGILVQTTVFGSMMTGVGLAADLSHGMIDRFRSLPMTRASFLIGRTVSDLIRNIFVILLMTIVGLIIGFRFEAGFFSALGAGALMLAFGFAFSWISATIGMAVKNVETAQSAGFIWVFPVVFASSIFVPVQTMSKGVRMFAEHNPVSYTANAVRGLTLGTPMGHDVWYSLAWIAGILIVFIPLAVNRYRKIA
jgi:ABC transporter DrrB family efflux protein